MRVDFRTVLVLLLILVVRSIGQSNRTTKLDELEDFECESVKARTENLYRELTKVPSARGYIIVYEGRYRQSSLSDQYQLPHVGEGYSRILAIKKQLKFLKISDAPIKIIFGGYREHLSAEYFIVPAGAAVPQPSPTLKRMRHRKGKAKFYVNPADC
jgi:hypothetical protein